QVRESPCDPRPSGLYDPFDLAACRSDPVGTVAASRPLGWTRGLSQRSAASRPLQVATPGGKPMRHSFALSLAALTVSAVALAQPAKPETAATVNGETISLADVDAVLKHMLPLTPLTAAQ